MRNNALIYAECGDEFYPTPATLVEKMLEGIDWYCISTVLEPSAGKGDILKALARKERDFGNRSFDVDCIEIDTNLRQILKYNLGEKKAELRAASKSIRDKYPHCESRYGGRWCYYDSKTRSYVDIPVKDRDRLNEIERECDSFFTNGIHIVHDDFLTYNPFKKYDLIIMNPPFSNGDKHLLKALQMQERGGSIVCLLNAETLRNPFTETRKELVRQLDKYNAQIEYIEDSFLTAERKTDVEVALIKVYIEAVQEESDIYNRLKEAEEYEDTFDPTVTDIEVTDFIKSTINLFNLEVKSGIELIRQYNALKPYLMNSFDQNNKYARPFLRLTDGTDRGYDDCVAVNVFLKKVRSKYWETLLSNPKFTGKLTSKLQEEYRKRVEKLSDYDFTEFNIYTLSAEMNAQIKKGIEDEIMVMFDRLTEEHSYYPECSKNRHLYDGWKTNKAHKIDKKVIIPCYGVFSSWDGLPRKYEARKVLEDIERILNFFDGHMSEEVDSWRRLEIYFDDYHTTKKIPLKYFTVTFYKKGTVHLEFTCPGLIERFNIYAAQNKAWLPPNYGKKKYKDLSAEERHVIDSFQGEAKYEEVMQRASYYLAAPIGAEVLMLTGGEGEEQ